MISVAPLGDRAVEKGYLVFRSADINVPRENLL